MLTAAYIAGFFDGEGSISGAINNGQCHLKVTLTQRKPEILHMINEQFPTSQGVFPKPGLKRMCYRLHWGLDDAKALLEAIKPYVVVKKEQLALAIKFIELSPGMGGDCTPEVRHARKFIIYDIQQHNDAIKRRA